MDTIGADLARRAIALRNRYGRYPIHDYQYGMEHSIVIWPEMDAAIEPVNVEVGIPDSLDYSRMKPERLGWLPENRADWRGRLRPLLPRASRLNTYSRRLHKPGGLSRADEGTT